MRKRYGKQLGSMALEVALGSVIFGILMVGITGSLGGSFEFMKTQNDQDNLSRKMLTATDRVRSSLRGALSESLALVDDGGNVEVADDNGDGTATVVDPTETLMTGYATGLNFTKIAGADENGSIIQTSPVSLFWRPGHGEQVDQRDNDNDGRVDEGDVIFIDVNGKRHLLTSDVPAGGFKITDEGDGFLTLSITIQVKSVAQNKLHARTVVTKVPLR